ncbi:flippase [Haloferax sp. Atlit-6N]|uniref:flippase n=1 Tax=Haloferax sp. Atlit-6N TaxID=2077205 RepID=UPI000E251D98|nr:flippase [Haloferax sp. Atlit-6N]REA00138.1 flippase [Haloferax sp. Atlit-6N]
MSNESSSVFAKLFASGGVIFLGLAFNFGLGFAGRLVIARFVGKVAYGAVSLGVTLMVASSTLILLGTHNGISRYLPRYDDPQQRRGVLLSAYSLVIPLSIAVGGCVFFFAEEIATSAFGDRTIAPVLAVFGLIIPLATLVKLTIGSIRGMQESLPRVYIKNISLPVVRFGLIAVAVAAGLGSYGIAWAYAGAYAVAVVLSLYYLVKHTVLFKRIKAASMHRELLLFSLPLMITAAMDLILSNFDTFMIGYFDTTAAVGVYNVAYPLANLLTIFLTAFNFVFMPMMSEYHANERYQEIVRSYQVVSKWIFLLTLPVFLLFTFYPHLIIQSTFGAEYLTGSTALSILTVGFFLHTIAGPNGNVLMSLGRSRLIMYNTLLVAAVNVALNIVLIPRYSLVGAAIATTVGYALLNSLYLFQLHTELHAHPFRAAILRPGLLAVLLWIALYLTVSAATVVRPLVLIPVLVVFLPLYLVIVLRYGGVEQEELKLVEQVEDRLDINLGFIRRLAQE